MENWKFEDSRCQIPTQPWQTTMAKLKVKNKNQEF
jgi:hypothetical protein